MGVCVGVSLGSGDGDGVGVGVSVGGGVGVAVGVNVGEGMWVAVDVGVAVEVGVKVACGAKGVAVAVAVSVGVDVAGENASSPLHAVRIPTKLIETRIKRSRKLLAPQKFNGGNIPDFTESSHNLHLSAGQRIFACAESISHFS